MRYPMSDPMNDSWRQEPQPGWGDAIVVGLVILAIVLAIAWRADAQITNPTGTATGAGVLHDATTLDAGRAFRVGGLKVTVPMGSDLEKFLAAKAGRHVTITIR